jgi:penicillin-binding protein 2
LQYLESRKYIILGIFSAVAIVFALKLFAIQVLSSEYRQAAQDNAIHRTIQYPSRGLIYDRKGELLVENRPVYDLMVTPRELREMDTARFCRVFELTLPEFRERLKTAKEYSWAKPSPFVPRMSTQDFAHVQDHLIDFPGFSISARTARGYPHQSLSHALGYIGEISPKRLEAWQSRGYKKGDYVGISGVEREYENWLMGKRGVKFRMVNVRGVDKGAWQDGKYDTLSVAGRNLYTTIDLKLQQYGEKLMLGKRGCVVAIEPATGEILSFISAPFYDPNLLTGKQFGKNYMALLNDPQKIMYTRPLMSPYPPGSIFKLVQSLVAMDQGTLTPATVYPCNKSLVNCHPHPSPNALHTAIQYSCNPYFYRVFQGMVNQGKSKSKFRDTAIGLARWREDILTFGFGNKLGIDLPNEKRGIIASPKLYDKVYGKDRWKFSTIYSLSIGQGEIGAVPLQMANLAAIIANRGWYVSPHLVKAIGERNSRVRKGYTEKHYTSVSAEYFAPIVDAMEAVVQSGTGFFAKIKDIAVCGKTGTAENPQGEDHAVFIAFAPKDNPKIAIAVYVENAGKGGMSAAPIAGLMIEKYLTDSISRKNVEDYVLAGKFIWD